MWARGGGGEGGEAGEGREGVELGMRSRAPPICGNCYDFGCDCFGELVLFRVGLLLFWGLGFIWEMLLLFRPKGGSEVLVLFKE